MLLYRKRSYNGRSNGDGNRSGMSESDQSRRGSVRGLSDLIDGYIWCWPVVAYDICSKVGGRPR